MQPLYVRCMVYKSQSCAMVRQCRCKQLGRLLGRVRPLIMATTDDLILQSFKDMCETTCDDLSRMAAELGSILSL